MSADGGSDQFRKVREVFEQALELPADQRRAFVGRECGHDWQLLAEVEELLACDADDGELGSLLDRGAGLLVADGRVEVGSSIGSFHLRAVLGSGGMGTVYEAEQEQPRRRVALKVLSLGLANAAAVRRFKWEAEVLARLRHPGIAQVHAVGVHESGDIELPWFAMELVPHARDLLSHARIESLAIRARVELFLQVCDAVHHGHLQGVVHRDLKPQNVLVDDAGRTKVIDFGIARSTAGDVPLTEGAVVLGTLHYMSPEQLRGLAVDMRSDIYSLGVVLFELLSGRRPFVFEETTPLVVAETVENHEPPRLSTVTRGIARDLEVVVQKALRRLPEDRYASVAEFADDLRAFLAERPVRARAPSTFYQVRMFARRRRGLVAAMGAILVLVVVALGVVLAQNAELARRSRVSQRLAAFTIDFLDQSSLMAARGVDYTVREALDVAAAKIEDETFDDAETEAELRQLIGRTYKGLSLPAVAQRHLRRARQLWLQIEGPGSARAVEAGISLVIAMREHGETEAAAALVDELAGAFPDDRRQDDPLWWTVQHNRAYVMRHQGRLADAERLYREVLAQRERLLGTECPEVVATMHNLGNLMLGLQRPAEARVMLADAVVRSRGSGQPEASTLQIVDNLAEAWRELGDLDEAAAKHRETMAGFEEIVGRDHHVTIGCGYHLLKVLYKQGKVAELAELAADLLERCERTFGLHDYRTMDVTQALAAARRGLGQLDEAVALMERALPIVEAERGACHPDTFSASHLLITMLLEAGDGAAAEQWASKMVRRLERTDQTQLPPYVPGVSTLLQARALARTGDARAGAVARRARDLLREVLPAEHPMRQQAEELASELGS